MKTLKENTADFVNEVKSILDNAYWNYETSYPERSNSDCEKSVLFLEKQKYSLGTVKEYLKNNWEDFVAYLRELKSDSDNCTWSNTEEAARFIAHELGFYRATSRLSVCLPESIIFKLIPNN